MRHKVFVYGTLKQGQCNHGYLKGLEKNTGSVRGYHLHAGPGYPHAVRGQGMIHGEVYQINERVLHALDHLEDVPRTYRRELTTVYLSDGSRATAWIYLSHRAYDFPRIPGGNW